MIEIVIADDHALFREGLRSLLQMEDDMHIAGEAGTGVQALRLSRELNPDVMLLDIDLPEMDGLEVLRRIREDGIDMKVIVLTMHTNEEYAVRVISLGALGFIPKYVSGRILPDAIRTVVKGGTFLPEEMREAVLNRMLEKTHSAVDSLTDRELQVFKALAEGQTINGIADSLNISPRTVETHKARIMEKMGLKNIAELVRAAIKFGIS